MITRDCLFKWNVEGLLFILGQKCQIKNVLLFLSSIYITYLFKISLLLLDLQILKKIYNSTFAFNHQGNFLMNLFLQNKRICIVIFDSVFKAAIFSVILVKQLSCNYTFPVIILLHDILDIFYCTLSRSK